jgi:hypothetical protein
MPVFNKQLTRMVSQNLYMLKRLYGGRVVFCSLVDADTDYETGVKTVQCESHQIHRAIVMPSNIVRDVVASVARISSNKKLAYGGEFNVGDRGFILQGSDLPDGWEVKKDDWIIYRGDRYSPKTILNICGGTGWLVVARKILGIPLTFYVTTHNAINLSDEASNG